MTQQPIYILKESTQRTRGRDAQSNNILAARAVADAVRSTLGPKGMDKMLVDASGDVLITNDGATILRTVEVRHPAAKMIVEVARTQETEIGDGTTTAVLLAGELLRRAEDLLDDVHPTLIARGYRLAEARALEILRAMAREVGDGDDAALASLARTSMASKGAGAESARLSKIVVRALAAVAEAGSDGRRVADRHHVRIVKKAGGAIADTELLAGIVLEKERMHPGMPTVVKDARIALLNVALAPRKTEIAAKISITDPKQVAAFLDEEERMVARLVRAVTDAGANVVLSQKGASDAAAQLLAREGVFAVTSVGAQELELLARATGARIVSDPGAFAKSDLGQAGLVEQRRIGEDEVTLVTECPNPRSVTILVRGGSPHVMDEVQRTLEDALGGVATAMDEGLYLAGAGGPEIGVALGLKKFAGTVGGREQLAIEAFAQAMEVVPRALAENAGLHAIDVLVELRRAHEAGRGTAGVDLSTGAVVDALARGVVEPLRSKTHAIRSATEVAIMILRIDDVIAAKAPGPVPA